MPNTLEISVTAKRMSKAEVLEYMRKLKERQEAEESLLSENQNQEDENETKLQT